MYTLRQCAIGWVVRASVLPVGKRLKVGWRERKTDVDASALARVKYETTDRHDS